MNLNMIKRVNKVTKRSIKTIFLDYSFPIVIILMVMVNLIALWHYDIIYSKNEIGITYDSIYLTSFFASLLVMAYGGYLGNKFFAKDIESRRIHPFLLIPDGKKPLLLGKILAGSLVLVILSMIYTVHMSISLTYWGPISYLTIQRLLIYSVLMFLAALLLYSVVTIISVLSKNVMATVLFLLSYLVMAFFLIQFTESAERSFRTFVKVMGFPVLNVIYNNFYIDEYGALPSVFYFLPLLGIVVGLAASYLLFDRVKS